MNAVGFPAQEKILRMRVKSGVSVWCVLTTWQKTWLTNLTYSLATSCTGSRPSFLKKPYGILYNTLPCKIVDPIIPPLRFAKVLSVRVARPYWFCPPISGIFLSNLCLKCYNNNKTVQKEILKNITRIPDVLKLRKLEHFSKKCWTIHLLFLQKKNSNISILQ